MTTSDNLSERIRFEAWAAPRGADTTYDSDNGYVNPDTAIAFSAWQARAAQLEAELSDLRRQLAEATKENNNSWLALLKEVAKLSDVIEPEDEWTQADDGDLLEQFDPWEVIKKATEWIGRNTGAELSALQPQPAVSIGNENPRMSYDKLSDILIIRNGDRDSYIRYIDGDIALVCEIDTDKVVGFEVEGFSIRAGLDRQPQPAPSPADTEAVREMFERDHYGEYTNFDRKPNGDYSCYEVHLAFSGYRIGYRRAFAAHAAEHTLADMAAGLLAEKVNDGR